VKKVGIIRFLGTNCDWDIQKWMASKGLQHEFLWFKNQFDVNNYDFLILPGGFSHGDYLRSGALAAKTPVMKSVREFAEKGGPVLGICNGFQILCEANLLPGVLVQNENLKFVDKFVKIKIENKANYFSSRLFSGSVLNLPIAHGDGRYYAPSDQLLKILDQEQVWLTYFEENPNGSLMNIAGVMNENKNVYGLMPHPERALTNWMGSPDGDLFL
jgi:phosphoribosylformylglycinamidine synthase I